MSTSKGPYQIVGADLPPICVGRNLDGRVTIHGMDDCQCCNHPMVELIDNFCRSDWALIDEEFINTVDELIGILRQKHPDFPLSEAAIKHHKKHLVDEIDAEDEEFMAFFATKYEKQMI